MAAQRIVSCPSCGTKNRLRASVDGTPRCGACHTLLPWLVEADAQSFDEHLAASVPVLVDFWAPWCGPCRTVSALVEALAHEEAGRLKVVKLNIDEAPEIAARYGIQSIPLLIVFHGGEERDRLVGAVPKAQTRQWLEPHLATAAA